MAAQQLSGDRNAEDGKDEEEEGDEEESEQGKGRGKEVSINKGGGKGSPRSAAAKKALILWRHINFSDRKNLIDARPPQRPGTTRVAAAFVNLMKNALS
jgi:hypothetical protein